MDETVHLDVSIHIDQHDEDYDTGITVAEWNAMTSKQRSDFYFGVWSAMAERDDGGVRVLTSGAEGL